MTVGLGGKIGRHAGDTKADFGRTVALDQGDTEPFDESAGSSGRHGSRTDHDLLEMWQRAVCWTVGCTVQVVHDRGHNTGGGNLLLLEDLPESVERVTRIEYQGPSNHRHG